MKLHYTKYTANYKEFILGCLDVEDTMKEEERINYIWDRFRQEYGHMIDRVGEQKALSEWLSGLALPLPFYNYDIIELAKSMGSVDKNLTEKQEDKILENYWDFMALMIIRMRRFFGTNKKLKRIN